jgi:hypothetical protein
MNVCGALFTQSARNHCQQNWSNNLTVRNRRRITLMTYHCMQFVLSARFLWSPSEHRVAYTLQREHCCCCWWWQWRSSCVVIDAVLENPAKRRQMPGLGQARNVYDRAGRWWPIKLAKIHLHTWQTRSVLFWLAIVCGVDIARLRQKQTLVVDARHAASRLHCIAAQKTPPVTLAYV